MKFLYPVVLVLLLVAPGNVSAQLSGFYDDFEDASTDTMWNEEVHPLWSTGSPDTYEITETGGQLHINYLKTEESGASDNFVFTPPEEIDISENPRLRFSLKSSVETELTIRALHLTRPPETEDFVLDIPGDDTRHTYTITLDTNIFDTHTLKRLIFVLDRDVVPSSKNEFSGTISIDNFRLAGFLIDIAEFAGEAENGTNIRLNWQSSAPEATGHYRIYRGTHKDFAVNDDSFIGTSETSEYLGENLDPYTSYFYAIIPVGDDGQEYYPSQKIRVETYEDGVSPEISITNTSGAQVGKYERFALELALQNIGIYNPYDPEDVDVHAWFKAPSGDTLHINGFYDDYQNADQWRLYFAPNETGTWEYQVFVEDVGGTGSTQKQTFEATDTEHVGPLKVSENNPNYLADHDDNFFYGLSVYYPWNVEQRGLDRLEEYGLNMIGYWNSTYDWAGNQGGNSLVESMESGLGRYDQQKLGRIEQILSWLEARDMKMMYAIWAHPFLRDGAPGWDPLDWKANNPYQEIVTTTEFYTDSLAWEYQKKQYRYLIARLGHHRALGIWEIINEIHGTTGYVNDEAAGRQWINKVHDYFKNHDPYQRPTTASFDGAENWVQHDVKADIANEHYYEGQGYPRPYNDAIRDGLFNVTEVYEELKQSGERPALLGEAGYYTMFSEAGTDNYTIEFHNAFWSGLARGMVSTPFWWDYTQEQDIFTDEIMETYQHLAGFVDKLNLANNPYELADARQESGVNAYTIYNEGNTNAFGWVRAYDSGEFEGRKFQVSNLQTGTYEVEWYNTWTGETAQTGHTVSIDYISHLTTPTTDSPEPDMAYRLTPAENGNEAAALNIQFQTAVVFPTGDPFTVFQFTVYITDSEGRLVEDASHEITLNLDGDGTLQPTTVTTSNGIAYFDYTPEDNGTGNFTITASAEGLTTATVNEKVITSSEKEEESVAPKTFHLQQNYPNPFNPSTVISYQLAQNSKVKLEVYDITGRKITTLVDQPQTAGHHQVTFDAGNLSSGVYLYRIQTDNFSETRRMVLVK